MHTSSVPVGHNEVEHEIESEVESEVESRGLESEHKARRQALLTYPVFRLHLKRAFTFTVIGSPTSHCVM